MVLICNVKVKIHNTKQAIMSTQICLFSRSEFTVSKSSELVDATLRKLACTMIQLQVNPIKIHHF